MDTTYRGRKFGIMVFRGGSIRRNLLRKEVDRETLGDYKEGIKQLIEKGWKIDGIVCDGKRGLLNGFAGIPVQMCHFHQKQIMTRYITKKLILPENRELKDIANFIGKLRKDTIKEWLDSQSIRNSAFLKERNDQGGFKHGRARSAYKSLKHNLPYLYTYKDVEGMPNTTNSLEGTFAHLKEKVGLHRGLRKQRKRKLIDDYLSRK